MKEINDYEYEHIQNLNPWMDFLIIQVILLLRVAINSDEHAYKACFYYWFFLQCLTEIYIMIFFMFLTLHETVYMQLSSWHTRMGSEGMDF